MCLRTFELITWRIEKYIMRTETRIDIGLWLERTIDKENVSSLINE